MRKNNAGIYEVGLSTAWSASIRRTPSYSQMIGRREAFGARRHRRQGRRSGWTPPTLRLAARSLSIHLASPACRSMLNRKQLRGSAPLRDFIRAHGDAVAPLRYLRDHQTVRRAWFVYLHVEWGAWRDMTRAIRGVPRPGAHRSRRGDRGRVQLAAAAGHITWSPSGSTPLPHRLMKICRSRRSAPPAGRSLRPREPARVENRPPRPATKTVLHVQSLPNTGDLAIELSGRELSARGNARSPGDVSLHRHGVSPAAPLRCRGLSRA